MKQSLTTEQIIETLTSTTSLRVLAKRYKCHPSTLSLVRLGKTHSDIAPHIPRWSTVQRCENCIHWLSELCSLGFPDPISEGTSFARECATFMRSKT